MNSTLLKYVFLLAILTFFSCDEDKEEDTLAPSIRITSPTNGTLLASGQIILQAMVSDDIGLKESILQITRVGEEMPLYKNTISHSGVQATIDENIILDVPAGGEFNLSINTVDQSNKETTASVAFQIANTNLGTLDLNFRLLYDGTPLVTFEEVTYPDPDIPMFISLVSAYISNVTISNGRDSIEILEIDRFRINEQHSDIETALAGTTISISSIPPDTYSSLKFHIGLPTDLNATTPIDYPQNHPLSFTGEYWDSWDSYIFFKVEGKVDTDKDGIKETGIALHGGSDKALRSKEFTMDFEVKPQETTTLVFNIDVNEIFERDGAIYDLISTPQIHSLDQITQTNELADNLRQAIN